MSDVRRALLRCLIESKYENTNRQEAAVLARIDADRLLRRYAAVLTLENVEEVVAAL